MLRALVACVATALLLRLCMSRLPTCEPRGDRWSCRTVCTCGGLAFFAVYFPLVLFAKGKGSMAALVVASFIVWFMGYWDDRRELRPFTKLKIEVVVALGLIACGWRLGWVGWLPADVFLSLLWIVGLTNALNLLDNMDALSAGVALIAAAWLGVLTGNPTAYVLVGITVGFLVFNLPPAQVFMGDCGALFLGLNLACLAMESNLGPGAALVLVVPLADTTFVTIRRLRRGRSPARGGLDHLSHELQKLGGVPLALIVLYAVGFAGGLASWFWVN